MSSTLLGEIWTLPVDTTSKLLLAYLADAADHTGRTPSVETHDLADISGRASKTVRRALNDLSKLGYLDRGGPDYQASGPWIINPYPGADLESDGPHLSVVKSDPGPIPPDDDSGGTAAIISEAEPSTPLDIKTQRLADFCAAWGLTLPSQTLIDAWYALETAEEKHNKTDKHHDTTTGKRWDELLESMAALQPAILHAVAVFQARAEQGLPNHADNPAAFVQKQLWLAPDYQVAIKAVGEPDTSLTLAEIDAMVMELNRAGGPFSCHLLSSMKDTDTGEILTETLPMYEKRVTAKYEAYQSQLGYFQE